MQDNHPITDQDILNNRRPGTHPDLDVGRRAEAGNQTDTDTGAGEEYTTAPRATDPEQELLDPGYDPQIPGESGQRGTTPPGQPEFAEHPGLGGMPNQQGELDQGANHG
ncbi:MAG TPA: hypothetical protein VJN88_05980 [Ktedonobacterales bacterium]|nr:hypothetical protein [Ktedonobacterales bacterium]